MDSEYGPTPEYDLHSAEEAIRTADANARSLRKAFDVCPLLDEEGNSDCDFADQIYRQKEERAWFARQSLNHLNGMIEQAHREIANRRGGRCAPEPGNDPDRPAIELGRHQAVLDDLVHHVRLLRQALAEADQKRYPGMKRWTRRDFAYERPPT